MRILKAILGATLVGGGLLLASVAAFATSATQSTTITFTVPLTLTMSGLAANYQATGPAGETTTISTGPLTIKTNDSAGYALSLQADGDFVGVHATMAASTDTVSVDSCPAGVGCASRALSTSPATILNRSAAPSASGDVFSVVHSIMPPGNQPSDEYHIGVSYVATAN